MQHQTSEEKSIDHIPAPDFRTLIIEDDEQVARMMILALKQIELCADHAASKEEAIELAAQNSYQLAIIDIHLGNDNGLELLERIRECLPAIDFITMTGDNPRTVETKVRELKVLYHLVKPFSINELNQLLTHIVQRHTTSSQDEQFIYI